MNHENTLNDSLPAKPCNEETITNLFNKQCCFSTTLDNHSIKDNKNSLSSSEIIRSNSLSKLCILTTDNNRPIAKYNCERNTNPAKGTVCNTVSNIDIKQKDISKTNDYYSRSFSLAATPTTLSNSLSPTNSETHTLTADDNYENNNNLQIMLLKSKDIAEQICADFKKLRYSNPKQKAINVLKLAINLLDPAYENNNNDKNSCNYKNTTLHGLGGPNFSAPTMLAHPDEFKNPSSFLKIYGDPLCGTSTLSNMKGNNGNWRCANCKNLNFPRRFRCNRCPAVRDAEGDKIVHEYASRVYYQHLKAYRKAYEYNNFYRANNNIRKRGKAGCIDSFEFENSDNAYVTNNKEYINVEGNSNKKFGSTGFCDISEDNRIND